MRKIKNSFISIFILLLIFDCGVNKVRYTYIPEDSQTLQNVNKTELLLHLYNEENVSKKIIIKTNTGQLLYSNNGVIKKSQYLKKELSKDANYITIIYNNKRNRIEINRHYGYLYIEFRGRDLLEIVYSDEEPEFID